MMQLALASHTLFIIALIGLGFWLKSINGVHGFVDRCLTPIPLGVGGCILVGLFG